MLTSRPVTRYFNQANKGVEVRGPGGKYPPMTAHQYILNALKRNFAQLELAQDGLQKAA